MEQTLANTFTIKEEYENNSESDPLELRGYLKDSGISQDEVVIANNTKTQLPSRISNTTINNNVRMECETANVSLTESTCDIKQEECEENSPNDTSTVNNIQKLLSSKIYETVEQHEMKIENEIVATDVKPDLSVKELSCDKCHEDYQDFCSKCCMLIHILNRNASENTDVKAKGEIPRNVLELRELCGHSGIFALKTIPKGVKFGPFIGLTTSESFWRIRNGKFIVEDDKLNFLNWMQYINPAKSIFKQNVFVFQHEYNIYYRTIREIQEDEELLVYFGEEYDDSLNKNIEMEFIPAIEQSTNYAFACAVCCLGYGRKEYLMKHKTICPNGSIENNRNEVSEITLCFFCKIFLEKQEYQEYHMSYCRERTARDRATMAIPKKKYCQESNGQVPAERKDITANLANLNGSRSVESLYPRIKDEVKHTQRKVVLCKYCAKDLPSNNFARHLKRHHAKETEVQDMLRYPSNSKEKRQAITLLRNDTNFKLFLEGTIRPRRVLKKQDQNRVYYPCPSCKGLYVKKYLRRHARHCVLNKISNNVVKQKRKKKTSPKTVKASMIDAPHKITKLKVKRQFKTKLHVKTVKSKSPTNALEKRMESESILSNTVDLKNDVNAEECNKDLDLSIAYNLRHRTTDLNESLESSSVETIESNAKKKDGKEFDSILTDKKRKLRNNKIVHCKYCSQDLVSKNFSRHLRRIHSKEKEVADMLQYPRHSKERRRVITLLRNHTNFDLYLKGIIRPNRRLLEYGGRNTMYYPCAYCKGLFVKEYLNRHAKSCVVKLVSNSSAKRMRENYLARSQTVTACALDSTRIIAKLNVKNEVFDLMKGDEISFEAKKDLLIAHFGELLLTKHSRRNIVHTCSNRMRGLARLLISYRKVTNDESVTLKTLLQSENFDNVLLAAQNIVGYNAVKRKCTFLNTALNLRISLKLVCDELMRLILRNKKGFEYDSDDERQKIVLNVKKFKEFVESRWNVELALIPHEDLESERLKSLVEVNLETCAVNQEENNIDCEDVQVAAVAENEPSTSNGLEDYIKELFSNYEMNDIGNIVAHQHTNSEEESVREYYNTGTKRRRGWSPEEVNILEQHFESFIRTGTYPSRRSVYEFIQITKINRTVPTIISKIQHLSKEIEMSGNMEDDNENSTSIFDTDYITARDLKNNEEQSSKITNNSVPKRKRGWSTEEVANIKRHFGSFIETGTYPARKSVLEFQQKTQIDRTVPMIISKIQHLINIQSIQN